jgi:hypothetical protein
LNDTGQDTVTDFNQGGGAVLNLGEGDKLNLADLLPDTASGSNLENLSQYLHFTEATPGGDLVLSVDPTGTNGAGVTQTITLEGVHLADLTLDTGANLNEQIIHALRSNMKLDGDA